MKDYEQARLRALRSATGDFRQAMRLMRAEDPQAAEDGFGLLRDIAAEHVQELLDEFSRESEPSMRCWLLELIGEARSPQAFARLAAELYSDDESLRDWAHRGLVLLDTREARRLLWQWENDLAAPSL